MTDAIRLAFGGRLKSARESVGLTQTDVAVRVALKKAAVSAWENGRGVPDALTLGHLAQMYRTSADALLFGAELSPEALAFAIRFDALNIEQRSMWLRLLSAVAP